MSDSSRHAACLAQFVEFYSALEHLAGVKLL